MKALSANLRGFGKFPNSISSVSAAVGLTSPTVSWVNLVRLDPEALHLILINPPIKDLTPST